MAFAVSSQELHQSMDKKKKTIYKEVWVHKPCFKLNNSSYYWSNYECYVRLFTILLIGMTSSSSQSE